MYRLRKYVSFYDTTASTWTLATPRTTWASASPTSPHKLLIITMRLRRSIVMPAPTTASADVLTAQLVQTDLHDHSTQLRILSALTNGLNPLSTTTTTPAAPTTPHRPRQSSSPERCSVFGEWGGTRDETPQFSPLKALSTPSSPASPVSLKAAGDAISIAHAVVVCLQRHVHALNLSQAAIPTATQQTVSAGAASAPCVMTSCLCLLLQLAENVHVKRWLHVRRSTSVSQ